MITLVFVALPFVWLAASCTVDRRASLKGLLESEDS